MQDLGGAAVAGTTTMLAVYGAGVIFVAQHVADRYSPLIYPRVVLRFAGWWTAALSAFVLAALALALLPSRDWTNWIDAALLVGALTALVSGLYRTLALGADRQEIIALVSGMTEGEVKATALRDMTWNAASRGDLTGVELLWAGIDINERAVLLDWVTQYATLLEQEWLRQLVIGTAFKEPLSQAGAEALRQPLQRLMKLSLDRGWYESAEDLTLSMIRAIEHAPTFSEDHAYLVFDLGFSLFCIGEEGRSEPRTAVPTVELDRVQEWFEARVIAIRRAVLRLHDRHSVQQFCYLLDRFADSGIAIEVVVAQIWDVLEQSYKDGTLGIDAVEALASTIGAARSPWRLRMEEQFPDDDRHLDLLDEIAAHVALYAVLLGAEDQVSRMMGNARLTVSSSMPRRLVVTNDLDETVYAKVARALGRRSWPA